MVQQRLFQEISSNEFLQKKEENSLEGSIYTSIFSELSSETNQQEIKEQFPKASIHRRNTGICSRRIVNLRLVWGRPVYN